MTRTDCPLPATVNQLSAKQRADLVDWIRELTMEGRHLEASTLYSTYFPLF